MADSPPLNAQIWIAPDALYDGDGLRSAIALPVLGGVAGQITALADVPQDAQVFKMSGTLCAGFLDLQVNGGGDALFNNDPSRASLHRMAAAHRNLGTAAILPTLITDAPDVLTRAVAAATPSSGEPVESAQAP